jgi:hypothetical protein
MRFKIKKPEKSKHTDIVSSVAWSNNNELFRYFFKAVYLMISQYGGGMQMARRYMFM